MPQPHLPTFVKSAPEVTKPTSPHRPRLMTATSRDHRNSTISSHAPLRSYTVFKYYSRHFFHFRVDINWNVDSRSSLPTAISAASPDLSATSLIYNSEPLPLFVCSAPRLYQSIEEFIICIFDWVGVQAVAHYKVGDDLQRVENSQKTRGKFWWSSGKYEPRIF